MALDRPLADKRGGIATVLLMLLLLAVAVGVGYYFYIETDKENYAEETIQLATDTSQSVLRLNDRSSAEEIAQVRGKIDAYSSRKDADPNAYESWIVSVETAEKQLTDRQSQALELQKRIEDFDLTSSLQEIESFDQTVKTFANQLDYRSAKTLIQTWSDKKNKMIADINSVSATIVARTFPSGAKTYLDGEYIGLSSLGIKNVRRGTHLLVFEKDGYLREELEIQVEQSETIEPESVELKLATSPLRVVVTGGKKKAKISISIEKTADDNDDIILYIDEKEGSEALFQEAPLGKLRVSVTSDLRLVEERVIDNEVSSELLLEFSLD